MNDDTGYYLTLEISNVGPIANAKMDIGKINIIGGQNSTGKSTSSKLLYSFLKCLSVDFIELVDKLVLPEIFSFIKDLKFVYDLFKDDDFELHWAFENNGDIFALLDLDKDGLFDSKGHVPIGMSYKELLGRCLELYELLESRVKIEDDFDLEDLRKLSAQSKFLEERKEKLAKELEAVKNNDFSAYASDNYDPRFIKDMINDNYQNTIYELDALKITNKRFRRNKMLLDLKNKSKRIEDFKKILHDDCELFEMLMKKLLSSEFDIEEANNFGFADFSGCYSQKMAGDWQLPFISRVEFGDYYCEYNGIVDDYNVVYLDSFSIFDFENYNLNNSSVFNTQHFKDLRKYLFADVEFDVLDQKYNKSIIKLEELINEIVGGKIIKEEGSLKFLSTKTDKSYSMKNTASGIKQITIIQTLLKKRHLQPNSFLILDEPETNIHPEWQLKLAHILVLLAKVGDINIYINTHSPLFIEAIDSYVDFYDLSDDTNYYLTEPVEDSMQYNIVSVDSDELYRIYDNLGQPYQDIDIIKLKTNLKENVEEN